MQEGKLFPDPLMVRARACRQHTCSSACTAAGGACSAAAAALTVWRVLLCWDLAQRTWRCCCCCWWTEMVPLPCMAWSLGRQHGCWCC